MKPVTITIHQNDDGTVITDVTYDIEYDLGYTAANILALMISEGINDEECSKIMLRKAQATIGQESQPDIAVDTSIVH